MTHSPEAAAPYFLLRPLPVGIGIFTLIFTSGATVMINISIAARQDGVRQQAKRLGD